MIRSELSRWLGWFFFRNFFIVNVGFLFVGICFSLMYYKVYRVRNGEFRRRLLFYFGTGAGYCGLSSLLWHPFFNEWMQWLLAIPHIIALAHLTYYIVIGGYGNEKHRI